MQGKAVQLLILLRYRLGISNRIRTRILIFDGIHVYYKLLAILSGKGLGIEFESGDRNMGVRRRRKSRRRMREKRKKKSEISGLVGCHSGRELPLDLVYEVLIRLPLKQLLRCMFVSKVWCSIIRQPSFVEAYRSRKPYCLVLSIPQEVDNELSLRRHLYCSNLSAFGHEEFFNLFNFSFPDSNIVGNLVGNHGVAQMITEFLCIKSVGNPVGNRGVTQMINGFFCSYCHTNVMLVNVFTGEVTRLPGPDVTGRPYTSIKYYFGYDRVNRLYKLLFAAEVCLSGLTLHNIVDVRVLTFGSGSDRDFSWVRLVPRFPVALLPDFFRSSDSMWVDGAFYWIVNAKRDFEEYQIFCFDLTNGQYFIARPNKFLQRPRLVQFRGRFSLFSSVEGSMIIHTLEIGDHGFGCWTEYKATLPAEFPCATPVGNLHTGELLLTNPRYSSLTPIYTYDHENNKFVRFVVGKFPQMVDLENKCTVSCVEQNIEMLDALISRFSPRY